MAHDTSYLLNTMNDKILFLILSCLKMNPCMICKSENDNILQNWVNQARSQLTSYDEVICPRNIYIHVHIFIRMSHTSKIDQKPRFTLRNHAPGHIDSQIFWNFQ